MRCIYCLRSDVSFNGREHVVPQFLGTFEPKSLLLKPVCDECNGGFSRDFEDLFKKDTQEGVISAQLGLRNPSQIEIKGERFVSSLAERTRDGIFDAIMVQIDPVTGMSKPREQVVFEFDNGARRVLFADDRKFEKNLKKFAGAACRKYIYAYNADRLAEIETLLGRAGVSYRKEGEREITEADLQSLANRSVEQRLDSRLCRLPAKIGFNYFGWSLLRLGKLELIYSSSFDAIREFIRLGTGINPVQVSTDQLMCQDGEVPRTAPVHLIVWRNDRGTAIAEVGLFALRRYTITLGGLPADMPPTCIAGNAHKCDLASRTLKEMEVVLAAPPQVPNKKAFPWGVEILPPN